MCKTGLGHYRTIQKRATESLRWIFELQLFHLCNQHQNLAPIAQHIVGLHQSGIRISHSNLWKPSSPNSFFPEVFHILPKFFS